jgi:hypothetical protein
MGTHRHIYRFAIALKTPFGVNATTFTQRVGQALVLDQILWR